jgi:hypothetical protein
MANHENDPHRTVESERIVRDAAARLGLLNTKRNGLAQSLRAWERLVASCRREAERAVG